MFVSVATTSCGRNYNQEWEELQSAVGGATTVNGRSYKKQWEELRWELWMYSSAGGLGDGASVSPCSPDIRPGERDGCISGGVQLDERLLGQRVLGGAVVVLQPDAFKRETTTASVNVCI